MATPVTIVTDLGVPVTPVASQNDITGLGTSDTPEFAGLTLGGVPVNPAPEQDDIPGVKTTDAPTFAGLNLTGPLVGTEQAAPAVAPANGYRIFAKDTGGKTELMVIFASGSAIRLAIEA
jgi:hypothetical protein